MKKVFITVVLFCISTALFAQKISPNVDHIALYVKDYKTSVSFYHEVLGLDSLPVMAKTDKQMSKYKIGEGIQLYVIGGRGTRDITQMNHSHLTFRVDSIELFAAKLNKLHVAWYGNGVRNTIASGVEGFKQISFKDPDGYEFEVIGSSAREAVASL